LTTPAGIFVKDNLKINFKVSVHVPVECEEQGTLSEEEEQSDSSRRGIAKVAGEGEEVREQEDEGEAERGEGLKVEKQAHSLRVLY